MRLIARAKSVVVGFVVGVWGFAVGTVTTLLLGLVFLWICAQVYTRPKADVDFIAGYGLVVFLIYLSGLAGLVFCAKRVYVFRKRSTAR